MTHSPGATEYKTDKSDYINIEIVFVTKSTINTVKRQMTSSEEMFTTETPDKELTFLEY